MPLTDILTKAAKPKDKAYKLADEKGLFLLVHPNGGKYWQMKYRFGGKEKLLSFGIYPETTLKEARDCRDDARKKIKAGIDPSHEKRLAKLTQAIHSENSFEAVTREWHSKQAEIWTARYCDSVLRNLEKDIFPHIGFRPISQITPPELLAVLRKIETRDALDIAKKMRQTCGQVLRYAIATGRAERDITADLQGALKTRKRQHFKRFEEKELPEFFRRLERYDTDFNGDFQTKLGLLLVFLTFVRTSELRGTEWQEIDFDKAEWHIPAERMKMKVKHIVPLSPQALKAFEELRSLNGNRQHVFPNRQNPKKFISENTLLYALYRMGYHGQATVHGFRATASTILNENGFRQDVIERQLSHGERNKVRAAYNHAQYLPERRQMMQWWGEYLENLISERPHDVRRA